MRRARGYTLIELLTVIAIAAIIMSISVGVFVRLGKKNQLEATTNSVRALLRRARNAAREERAPAQVEIDSEAGEVRAQTRETITLFRFESDQLDDAPGGSGKGAPGATLSESGIRGSHGIVGRVVGADSIEGRFGLGLDFQQPGSHVAVPDRPALSPLEGVAVEAWVFPAKLEDKIPKQQDSQKPKLSAAASAQTPGTPPTPTPPRALKYWQRHPEDPPLFTVVRKGRAYELAVTADYAVQCAITGLPAGASKEQDEITYVARTAPYSLKPEKWARLELVFDGRELVCSVDGIRRGLSPTKDASPLPARLVRDRSPLLISDPDPERGFVGSIDEVKLQGVIRGERVLVPKNMALLAPQPEIRFDALGQLDPLRHAEPVVFWISDDERAVAALLPPPEPGGNKTRERPRSQLDLAAQKAAADHQKAARFAELAGKLAERAKQIGVELTGAVR